LSPYNKLRKVRNEQLSTAQYWPLLRGVVGPVKIFSGSSASAERVIEDTQNNPPADRLIAVALPVRRVGV
jgi:hypothetical protein